MHVEDRPEALPLADVAELVGGRVVGEENPLIGGVSSLAGAEPGDITFLANSRYRGQLATTRASAVFVSIEEADQDLGMPLVVVDDPSQAFSRIAARFVPVPPRPEPGIDPSAVVSEESELGEDVFVGAGVTIEAGARIGDRAILYPGVYIGPEAELGNDVVLRPNVVIERRVRLGHRVTVHSGTVIGSDGFGYHLVDGKAIKIPQEGTVEVEDDVEIGANVAIDRARFDRTLISRGSKIDNLCQIAHNVEIGESTYLAAQTGIAGSCQVGRGVMMGGQVGLSGHLSVGDGARIAAQAGVSRDLPGGASYAGYPAMPARQYWKMIAMAKRVPVLLAEMASLEKRISELEGIAENDSTTA